MPGKDRDYGILEETGEFALAGTSIVLQVCPSFWISFHVNDTTIFPVTQDSDLHILLFAFLSMPLSSPKNHHLSSKSLENGFPHPQVHHLPPRSLWQSLLILLPLSCFPLACDLHHCYRALSRMWTGSPLFHRRSVTALRISTCSSAGQMRSGAICSLLNLPEPPVSGCSSAHSLRSHYMELLRVMDNFMCQRDWITGVPRYLAKHYF